jgi:hypothetical protein
LLAHTSVPSCASSKKNCTRVWLYCTCSYSPYELLLCYPRSFKRGKTKKYDFVTEIWVTRFTVQWEQLYCRWCFKINIIIIEKLQ